MKELAKWVNFPGAAITINQVIIVREYPQVQPPQRAMAQKSAIMKLLMRSRK